MIQINSILAFFEITINPTQKILKFLWVVLCFPYNYCRAFLRIFVYTIKAIRRSPLFMLDLSDLNLLWIPQIIIFYPAREINLSGNYLIFLPLGFLLLKKHLKVLELENNCFRKIPPALYKFTTLEALKLNGNYIQTIPPAISGLKNLKRLFFAKNKLETIDPAIGDLDQLTCLILEKNPKLSVIPDAIGQLIHLGVLSLRNTNITTLPISLKNLNMATQADFFVHPSPMIMMPVGWESMNLEYAFSQGLEIDNEKFGLPRTVEKFRTDRVFGYIFGSVEERVEIIKDHLSDENTYEKMLDFSGLKLQTFPFDLSLLKDVPLHFLNLSKNEFTTLPKGLGHLKQLYQLYINENKLTTFSEEIGNLESLVKLNAYDNQLTTLPKSINKLQKLEELNLSGNQLTTLPDEIGDLKALKDLLLINNQLTVLPKSIGNLPQLNDLHLDNNRLQSLPPAISNLKLRYLNLSQNQFNIFPKEILLLSNLGYLNLSNNTIPTLPVELNLLPLLYALYLNKNQLKQLPDTLFQLKKLKRVSFNDNEIEEISPLIGQLKKLNDLNLEHNKITTLPATIGDLEYLTELSLEDNNLTSIPKELANLSNLSKFKIGKNNLPFDVPLTVQSKPPQKVIQYILKKQEK